MLGNFFRSSTDHKQRVNKTQKILITCKPDTEDSYHV